MEALPESSTPSHSSRRARARFSVTVCWAPAAGRGEYCGRRTRPHARSGGTWLVCARSAACRAAMRKRWVSRQSPTPESAEHYNRSGGLMMDKAPRDNVDARRYADRAAYRLGGLCRYGCRLRNLLYSGTVSQARDRVSFEDKHRGRRSRSNQRVAGVALGPAESLPNILRGRPLVVVISVEEPVALLRHPSIRSPRFCRDSRGACRAGYGWVFIRDDHSVERLDARGPD